MPRNVSSLAAVTLVALAAAAAWTGAGRPACCGAAFFPDAPAAVPASAATTVITVEDMDCACCARKIVTDLKKVAGVSGAVADVKASTLKVFATAGGAPSPRGLWQAVEKAGFTPTKLVGPAGTFAALPPQ